MYQQEDTREYPVDEDSSQESDVIVEEVALVLVLRKYVENVVEIEIQGDPEEDGVDEVVLLERCSINLSFPDVFDTTWLYLILGRLDLSKQRRVEHQPRLL